LQAGSFIERVDYSAITATSAGLTGPASLLAIIFKVTTTGTSTHASNFTLSLFIHRCKASLMHVARYSTSLLKLACNTIERAAPKLQLAISQLPVITAAQAGDI
jgi:hypothetical protein